MPTRTALIHCNAGVDYGMGHLMRCLGVAEEAVRQDWHVVIAGDLDAAASRVARQFTPEVEVHAVTEVSLGEWIARTTKRLAPDVLHLDTYWLQHDNVPRGVPLVSNMQDDVFGRRRAGLAIDGNLGAERRFTPEADRPPVILGTAGAVIRRQVLENRTTAPPAERDARHILIVLGGTDPLGLTARCLKAIGAISLPLEITVVCRPEYRSNVETVAATTPHPVTILPFIANLPALARQQDLIVSAAGTSVWDFACMGVPMALICAADNQRSGYEAAVAGGLAVPLGTAPYDDLDLRATAVEALLRDRHALAAARSHLMRTVDGHGAWRIVSSWGQLLGHRRADIGTQGIMLRLATPSDAVRLREWRNDEATRVASRSQEIVDADSHTAWLMRSLQNPDRRLYIAEFASIPIGTVRWDRKDDTWEISITVAPQARGRGLAAPMLAAAEQALDVDHATSALAVVHNDNNGSARLFAGAGYLPYLPADEDGFATYAKWLFPA